MSHVRWISGSDHSRTPGSTAIHTLAYPTYVHVVGRSSLFPMFWCETQHCAYQLVCTQAWRVKSILFPAEYIDDNGLIIGFQLSARSNLLFPGACFLNSRVSRLHRKCEQLTIILQSDLGILSVKSINWFFRGETMRVSPPSRLLIEPLDGFG
jgi:hypothetical protein